MSNESWIKQYYPVKANKGSKNKAIQHSLNKWIGLLSENLKKHGIDSPPIDIDASTCALCYHYYKIEGDCYNCPLCITRSNTPCDCYNNSFDNNKDSNSPYYEYHINKNPQPMIYWLTKTKETQL